MNCCNDFGTCTQDQDCPVREAATVAPSKAPVRKYTCAQLGVCQGHQPPCIGCFDGRDAVACNELPVTMESGLVDAIYYWVPQVITAVITVVVVAGSAGYLITRAAGA